MEQQHVVMEFRIDLWEAFKLGCGFTLGALLFPLPLLAEAVRSLILGIAWVVSLPLRRRGSV